MARHCNTAPSYLLHKQSGRGRLIWPDPLGIRQERLLPGGTGRRSQRWQKEHRRHPNQLRHTFATRVRKQDGLEAARVLLGHSRADVTQIYAERNEELAVAVASKIG